MASKKRQRTSHAHQRQQHHSAALVQWLPAAQGYQHQTQGTGSACLHQPRGLRRVRDAAFEHAYQQLGMDFGSTHGRAQCGGNDV